MGPADGTQLLVDALGEASDRADAQKAAAEAQALAAQGALARVKADRDRRADTRTEALRLHEAYVERVRELQALATSPLPEAELKTAFETLKQRAIDLATERLELFRTGMAQAGAADLLFAKVVPGQEKLECQSEVRRVGEVEGCSLWIGEIRGRHPDNRLLYEGAVAELDADGWYTWRGPLRGSQNAALDAAARLAWSELQDKCVPDPYAPGSWPGFLIPEQSAPVLAALAEDGALEEFRTHEEQTGDTFEVKMSCVSGGLRLARTAAGACVEKARELCARRLLGVLAGETGFGGVAWPPGEVEERLEALAREPWLEEVRRRSWPARGGGRHVEVSCRVDGVVVRAEAVAAEEPVAVSTAAWLLVQRLGRGGKAVVLDARPQCAAGALRGCGSGARPERWSSLTGRAGPRRWSRRWNSAGGVCGRPARSASRPFEGCWRRCGAGRWRPGWRRRQGWARSGPAGCVSVPGAASASKTSGSCGGSLVRGAVVRGRGGGRPAGV
ncbi:hypothetical protein O1L68_41385 [Streptomyces lydicus]|nr:hypothetical protein [Streptomyces lydicus]